MTDLAKLVVRLEAQTAQYDKKLDAATKKMDRFGKRTKGTLKNVNVAFAGLAVAAFTKKIIDATAKQEAAVKQLEQGLASTGNLVGVSLKALTQQASELQKVTTFGDEDIIKAQSQLVTFTKITGKEFSRTIEIAADLSERFGTDLKSSVLQLGKALNDPVANLSALSRAGIQFSQDQKDVIKALIESGDQAEAQRVILKELETQFGGSAKAAGDTFGGALKGLGNDIGDLFESKTGLPAATEAVKEFRAQVQDPEFQKGFESLSSNAIKAFTAITQAVITTTNVVSFYADEVKAILKGVAAGDIVRIEDQIKEVQSLLSDDSLFGKLNRVRFFGKDGAVEYYDKSELQQKLSELQAARDAFFSNQKSVDALIPVVQRGSPVTPAVDSAGGGAVTSSAGSQTQFDAIVTSLLSEEDQIAQSYARRRAIVEQNTIEGSARRAELLAGIREQEAAAQFEREEIEDEDKQSKYQLEISSFAALQDSLTKIVESGARRRAEFEKKSSAGKTKAVLGDVIGITAGVAQSNKKLFKINKAAAIANATIGAIQGAARTFGQYPFPINAVMAGLSLAAGFAQVSNIKSTSFSGGGGGTTPSAAASVPVINSHPVGGINADITEIGSAPQKDINVIINDAIDPSGTRRILEAVNEALGDGAQLNVEVA